MDFVLWFLRAEFLGKTGGMTEELIDAVIKEIAERLGEINALVIERLASIADELDLAEECLECPRCHQATLMFAEQEPIRCAFCVWSPVDGGTAAIEDVHSVKGIGRVHRAD